MPHNMKFPHTVIKTIFVVVNLKTALFVYVELQHLVVLRQSDVSEQTFDSILR
jgi:hypothetical protein